MYNDHENQHSSVQSIQMGQLEHISTNMDSSVNVGLMGPGISDPRIQQMSKPNSRMGLMGSVSSSALSQHISISDQQSLLLEPVRHDHVPQKFSISSMQVLPPEYGVASQHFLLPNRQSGEMQTVLNSVGSQQLSMMNKRKAPVEAASNLVASKRVAHLEHRPWLQQMATSNKLPVHMQSVSNISGLQRPQVPSKRPAPSKNGQQMFQKNQTGQMQPSPRSQNESNSVRSKLRESFAAALALVSQQHNTTSSTGKNSESDAASTPGQKGEGSQPLGQPSGAAAHIPEDVKVSVPNSEDFLAKYHIGGRDASLETSADQNAVGLSLSSKMNGQELSSNILLRDDDTTFSDSFFVKDELLQGNGLSWVLEGGVEVAEEKDVHVAPEELSKQDADGGRVQAVDSPENLAFKIEAELFKLFGGVNKKYKERGRSLMFNLKDRNNPELRERVMSGEIPPERLCSMTVEELASKELSQWRVAKAEEFAQMVVLPDTDMDVRRLVKKTHKGEFQVELEEQDSVSVEVSVGRNSRTQLRPKSKEKEASSSPKSDLVKDTVKSKVKANVEGNNSEQDTPVSLTIPSVEGSDLMQGLIVDDELKDAEFLPPIVSLDEFMESLNSEPPFENLPVDAEKATPVSEKNNSPVGSVSKSPDQASEVPVSNTPESVKPKKIDRKPIDGSVKSETKPSVALSKVDHLWEGILQVNVSVMPSVVGIFKSGEKTSLKEWPGIVEIKGRVRLDAFEKFLKELRMSRSRAVMAVHFTSKEGSVDSERATLSEVADSYVSDGRVGIAEPVGGMELYLCPSHSKTIEMLSNVLPKDQLNGIVDNGLIGVVIWRKITSTASPNNHKHNSKKQHSTSSRRHQDKDTNVNVVNMTPRNTPLPPPPADDDDDVPPGFGPPGGGRDDDDLPEFNFSSGVPSRQQQLPTQKGVGFNPHTHSQMRELVQKYGQPSSSTENWQDNKRVRPPWNDDDDDDDMPEWRPDDDQIQRPPQQPHPQPVHIQQPMPRNQMVQHHQPSPAMPLHPHMNMVPWQQQGTWMPAPASALPTAAALPPGYQANGRQYCGVPGGGGQQGVAWRSDIPKSRGF